MSWRQCEDALQEVARLDITADIKRLNWGRRKLKAELDRVASEDAFRLNVHRALKELDPPRFLSRNTGDKDGRGFTDVPYLALEPVEAPSEEWVAEESKVRRTAYMDAQTQHNEGRRRHSFGFRLIKVEGDAKKRGVNIDIILGRIARDIERAERRVDRV